MIARFYRMSEEMPKLEADNARLRDALEQIASIWKSSGDDVSVGERSDQAYDMGCVARTALSDEPKEEVEHGRE